MKHLFLILMMLPMLLFGQSKIRNTQITSGNASAKKVLTSDGATNAIWDSVHVSGLVGDVPLFTKTDSTTQIIANVEYGALYNFYAAVDSRKISSSDDWVVPSDAQCTTLTTYLGGTSIAGGKLKETGTTHWNSPNTGATNETGFNARGTGRRTSGFSSLKDLNQFHTSTIYTPNPILSLAFKLTHNSDDAIITTSYISYEGHAVRLLYAGAGTPTEYVGNDGKVYDVVQIGSQYWLAENLNETKFRNGEWINGYNGGVYTPISNAAWAALTTAGMCYYNNLEANGGTTTTQTNYIEVNLGDTIYIQKIDHLVPYRGSVDSLVTTYPIKATQFIADTTYISDGLEQSGSLFWDEGNSTLSYQIPDGGTIQVNQEPFDLYHNLEGATIVNGDIVSTCGASGNRTAVCLTDATNDTKSLAAFGMVTVPSILNNNVGRITKSGGKVRQLNTIAYTEGTVLYVDPLNKGKWTSTMPSAPNRAIKIGTVSVSHAVNGVVELDIQVLPKMTELADVNGTPLNASGQIPVWNNTNKYFDFTENINDYKHVNYCPTNLTVNTGVLNQGAVADLCAIGGTDVIVQENNGPDPLRVTLSFSNVARLTSFSFYGRYSGGAGHVVYVEAYNYTLSSWQLLGELGTNTAKQWYSYNVFLPTNYVSAGVVQVRFNHQGNGVNTHQLIIDYVDVNYGGGGGSSFQTASEIAYIPYGTTGSTNVQNAINELTDEKIQKVTSTDNAVVRYDGTTGVVQNSGVTVDDLNNVNVPSGSNYQVNGVALIANGTDNFIPKYSSNTLNQSILNVTGSENLKISTYKGANSDGNNIYIGGGGQSSVGVVGETYRGSNNTSIGVSSLNNVTTGYNNVANGAYSLKSVQTGVNNTALGAYALENNSSSSNVAIGTQALDFNTTGYNNTAIGAYSGRYYGFGTDQNTNSINCLYIGNNTRTKEANSTNEIVIGYNTIGNGSNTATIGDGSVTKTYLSPVIILRTSSSAPTGVEGGIYYNSTDKHFYGYDGTSWKQLDN